MAKRSWGELSRARRTAFVVAGAVQLGLAAAAWWDLARRPAERVRGAKRVWAAVIGINYVGPLAYFRWGRQPR
ncbi:Phospholipase_D-nuclease N-terminal [Amycolatopsis arida]|uniref:Phospholipase_D-nuclease N-terminal n=1 Tax=Amycolatopsis arida TaxID=587909 RepID=A0A1I5VMM6_9PSEU|nr:PLDc N-terminal domain-containing protein [Amycolatopsis arida]TDX87956.1 phospholipase D-like protein [Amycolatopsis arida]SFQ08755.1 Phospholipase_D-nuclease N-terminal [Amycolatopsis arida]